jgi:two-component system, OmpR family, manganese sensing response regulator
LEDRTDKSALNALGQSETESSASKVLVVEDNAELNELLRETLTARGFVVTAVDSAEKGLDLLAREEFRLILLDWELPGKSGLDLCAAARAQGVVSSILFLTARSDIDDKVAGLDSGGDDYLTKPFEMREMLARVKALLSRPSILSRTVISIAGVELDKEHHTVKVKGIPVKITSQEFAILDLLMTHPGRVYSPDEILNQAWKTDAEGSNQAVRSAIMRIRAKVNPDDDTDVVVSVKGVGYKFGP